MSLAALLRRADLWRGDAAATPPLPGVPTGFDALDACLPGGGWPAGALTEILSEGEGAALRLALPSLARLSREDKWLVWVAPPYIPYAPALAAARVRLEQMLVVTPGNDGDALWAAEQALRARGHGAVLIWLPKAHPRALRRLQLAAEAGEGVGLVFRPERARAESSPAALRLRVEAAPDGRLNVHVVKSRGGWGMPSLTLSAG